MRFSAGIMVLIGLLIFLQYRLWFQPDGIKDMIKLKKALHVQQTDNLKLKEANEKLLFQIKRLQNSEDATEARARNELGMIKKGETFYQIIKR